jgi:hypothetical protein
VKSCDQPLFVLNYRRGHVFLRMLCFSLIILFILGIAFVTPITGKQALVLLLFVEIVCGLLLFSFIFQAVDLLFFREIRLYHDRVVKVWAFARRREITLENARLANTSTQGIRSKSVCNQDATWLSARFKGIFYYEDLPNPEDMKKWYRLLADLSGRNAEDFEQPGIRMDRLIKGAKT